MIHLLIEHDLVDREYIASHTTGFDALELSVRKYTPEYVARITGLDPETIFKAAMTYGNARAPFIGWTMGVNHSTQGTETVNAINNLALITGNVGKPGASPFSITGQCNAMGTHEAEALRPRPHDRVDIESSRGGVRGVELRVTEIIAPGQVFMPFHFAETNSNIVTLGAFDPISREPNFKQCAVRLERTPMRDRRRASPQKSGPHRP